MSARRGSGPSPGRGSTIQWASALAALPDPLFIMEAIRDPDGTVVELVYAFLNEAAARLYGKSVDQVLGHGHASCSRRLRSWGSGTPTWALERNLQAKGADEYVPPRGQSRGH